MFTAPAGLFSTPAAAAASPVSFSYVTGADQSSTAGSSYTFNISTGAAGPLIVCIGATRALTSGAGISSVVVGGVGHSALYSNVGAADNTSCSLAGVAYVNGPGGTVNVVVNLAASSYFACSIALFNVDHMKGGIYSAGTTGGYGTSISTSMSIGGSLGIGFAACSNNGSASISSAGSAFSTYYNSGCLLAGCTGAIGPQSVSIVNSGSPASNRAIAGLSLY